MFGGSVKTMVLIVLVLQNSSLVLIMRASRLVEGPMYLTSTVVFLGELFKLFASLGLLFREVKYDWKKFTSLINNQCNSHMDNLKICIPAVLYLIQNNLVFVAISNMDAGSYQVLYQLKIFTTAIMSVLLLNKKLTLQHWVSLLILFVGVVLVQQSTSSTKATPDSDSGRPDQKPFVGFMAIIVAVCCSGMAGVWFEKMLKTTRTSVWMRNLQLSTISLVFAFASIVINDAETVRTEGMFRGFSWIVIAVILCQAGGGILVALVVKYADNIIKGFACSLATLVSTVGSMYLFAFVPTSKFVFGGILVVASAFYYGLVDGRQRQVVAAKSEPNKRPNFSATTKEDSEVDRLLNAKKEDETLDKL